MRAGRRERRASALARRRGDREAAAADALRAGRLQERGRILDRVPAVVAVSGCRDEEDSLRDRVVDRALLDRGGRRSAETEVDDLRAVVDRVDDRRGLVDVREGAARTARLHDHQARLARDAGDAVPVRRRAGCESRDEGAVAVAVGDVRLPLADAVGVRRLRAEIRCAEVGAGVDHRDREARRRLRHRRGDLIRPHGRVLPLERHGGGERGKGGLDERPSSRRPLDAEDSGLRADLRRIALDVPARTHHGDVESTDAAHDLRGLTLERRRQRLLALVRDDGGAARPRDGGARVGRAQGGAGERKDRRHGEAPLFTSRIQISLI